MPKQNRLVEKLYKQRFSNDEARVLYMDIETVTHRRADSHTVDGLHYWYTLLLIYFVVLNFFFSFDSRPGPVVFWSEFIFNIIRATNALLPSDKASQS